METAIIKIGNSKGLRLSKTILEKYDIKETVELILEEDRIIIVPHQQPRKGWDKAFKRMHLNKDDKLIVDDVFTDEEFE